MSNWPKYYVLLERTPMAVDIMTWGAWFEEHRNRRIDRTEIDDHCHVSTVFLGLDHNFSDRGDPVLFETMIFGGPLDQEQWRYCTYSEAEHGHAEAVTQAKIACARVKALAVAAGATMEK